MELTDQNISNSVLMAAKEKFEEDYNSGNFRLRCAEEDAYILGFCRGITHLAEIREEKIKKIIGDEMA
jgi:hypothetical protein